MGCDVCIGGGDYDGYPEFYTIGMVKARKDHKCLECREIIPKGSIYQRHSGKFDGALYCDKTCAACADIAHVYSCGEPMPVPGELWREMFDQFQDFRMAGDCWDSLTAPAKAKLLDKWREWKGLTK